MSPNEEPAATNFLALVLLHLHIKFTKCHCHPQKRLWSWASQMVGQPVGLYVVWNLNIGHYSFAVITYYVQFPFSLMSLTQHNNLKPHRSDISQIKGFLTLWLCWNHGLCFTYKNIYMYEMAFKHFSFPITLNLLSNTSTSIFHIHMIAIDSQYTQYKLFRRPIISK